MHSTSFSMELRGDVGMGYCLQLHMWGGGIWCKCECYTRTDRFYFSNNLQINVFNRTTTVVSFWHFLIVVKNLQTAVGHVQLIAKLICAEASRYLKLYGQTLLRLDFLIGPLSVSRWKMSSEFLIIFVPKLLIMVEV